MGVVSSDPGGDAVKKDKQGPPVSIFLQWHCGEHYPEWGDPDPGDVTWAEDAIFDDDVAYVRKGAVKYRSAVSGMWYTRRKTAGDVDMIEVDGVRFPVIQGVMR